MPSQVLFIEKGSYVCTIGSTLMIATSDIRMTTYVGGIAKHPYVDIHYGCESDTGDIIIGIERCTSYPVMYYDRSDYQRYCTSSICVDDSLFIPIRWDTVYQSLRKGYLKEETTKVSYDGTTVVGILPPTTYFYGNGSYSTVPGTESIVQRVMESRIQPYIGRILLHNPLVTNVRSTVALISPYAVRVWYIWCRRGDNRYVYKKKWRRDYTPIRIVSPMLKKTYLPSEVQVLQSHTIYPRVPHYYSDISITSNLH